MRWIFSGDRCGAKTLLGLGLLLTAAYPALAQRAIRKVDFRNFTYRAYCAEDEPGRFRVRNGHYSRAGDDPVHFDVQPADYGDLTGDGSDEAIVLPNCDEGGTGYFSEGFIYTLRQGKPVLLARVPGGDRADGGLYRLSIRRGLVIVESYAHEATGGVCCPDFIDTTSYRWNGRKLVQAGPRSRRDYKPDE